MRISQKFEPSITTISMDFREIGKETYYVREHLIRRESKCSRISVSIPACIIPRESTGNLSLKEALPQAGSQSVSTFESGNNFFTNPTINSLIRFENCLSNRDEIDQKIIMAILQGKSYEQMEGDALYERQRDPLPPEQDLPGRRGLQPGGIRAAADIPVFYLTVYIILSDFPGIRQGHKVCNWPILKNNIDTRS